MDGHRQYGDKGNNRHNKEITCALWQQSFILLLLKWIIGQTNAMGKKTNLYTTKTRVRFQTTGRDRWKETMTMGEHNAGQGKDSKRGWGGPIKLTLIVLKLAVV